MTESSRRTFLGGAAALGALPATQSGLFRSSNDTLRVGLIGAGGRGTGAAAQALRADMGARLVAVGDAFQDRIDGSLNGLAKTEDIKDRVDVPAERRFTDFDNFKKVIDSDIDVVILASPPHFRPEHLDYAVAKGVHVFCEKPVAVDGPGVRQVLDACRKAKEKNLNVVSGLCYRYHDGRRAILNEIHDGRIGQIRSMHVNYITGALWHRGESDKWSDMEYQCRNWLYYTWLSGDHIAEQHIHSLDVMAWAMKDVYPSSAVSLGGRQSRTEDKFGHVYDHFATIYEWENGVKGHSYCRQQAGTYREVNDYITGSTGEANVFQHRIKGDFPWKLPRGFKMGNMYQNEHDELFAAIRAGKAINNGEYMAHSTLMAIMGRMAGYTGQKVTWQQALNSNERLGPKSYAWTDVPTADVALPGITKLG